jgi:aspartate kinase
MALIVLKYGGIDGLDRAHPQCRQARTKWARAGHQMVVVPSAMSGETNRLLGLAKEVSAKQTPEMLPSWT